MSGKYLEFMTKNQKTIKMCYFGPSSEKFERGGGGGGGSFF